LLAASSVDGVEQRQQPGEPGRVPTLDDRVLPDRQEVLCLTFEQPAVATQLIRLDVELLSHGGHDA
jgi:hypothetical protein